MMKNFQRLFFIFTFFLSFLVSFSQPVLAQTAEQSCLLRGDHKWCADTISCVPTNQTCPTRGAIQPGPGSPLGGITNKAISPELGGDPGAASSGSTFAKYFIVIWQGLIVLGSLAMLFNLVNGAMEWITAGGEQEKVKHARMKMTEGIVGLIILVGSFAAVMFIGQVFQFNVLQIDIPSP